MVKEWGICINLRTFLFGIGYWESDNEFMIHLGPVAIFIEFEQEE